MDTLSILKSSLSGRNPQFWHIAKTILSDGVVIARKKHKSALINCEVEKVNELQENLFVNINIGKECLFLEVENGINNGTQLNDFSFEEGTPPISRTRLVFSHIELDSHAVKRFFKKKGMRTNWRKIKALFEQNKHRIEEGIRQSYYDEYVTGEKSRHYLSKDSKYLNEQGVFWVANYTNIDIDVHTRIR